LCLKVFPWAEFRKTKGAIKLHFGLDTDGYLPTIMNLSNGKSHEMLWAKALTLQPGSCVVFDRGYNDYSWYQTLTKRKITFVTRLKRNADVEHLGKWRNSKIDNVESDKRIRLKGMTTNLRLVTYRDPETEKVFHFLTNSFRLDAATIAELYKERWQIELFFKWIKQNLKVKTFLGTSKNAVLTQLWIALCVYLFLSFLKFKAKLGLSLATILRLLQLNLFERRALMDLLKPPDKTEPVVSPQLLLWDQL
jgi:transposase